MNMPPGRGTIKRKGGGGLLFKDLTVGQSCVVERLDLPFQIERRLQALGMTQDTRLQVLNRKGKGIMIIKLRGTRLALGCNITRRISVRKVGW